MACVAERADGTLLACGDNGGAEAFAIGRSADAMSWTTLARFTDIAGPLDCPAGTLQNDCAVGLAWLEICDAIDVCTTPDAGPPGDDAGVDPPRDTGCCSVSGPGRGLLAAVAVLLAALLGLWRRRRVPG